jgi:3-methylcrotonyl-CoA carboxylase alpha subunit
MVEPSVTRLGAGRFLVESDGMRRLAYAVRQGRRVWVFIDGVASIVADERSGSSATGPHDDAELSAPMPARVLNVTAEVGQHVTRGDVLVTLEAMKMELPLRAPRDGIVKAVSCQTGRMVNAGDRLVELE